MGDCNPFTITKKGKKTRQIPRSAILFKNYPFPLGGEEKKNRVTNEGRGNVDVEGPITTGLNPRYSKQKKKGQQKVGDGYPRMGIVHAL